MKPDLAIAYSIMKKNRKGKGSLAPKTSEAPAEKMGLESSGSLVDRIRAKMSKGGEVECMADGGEVEDDFDIMDDSDLSIEGAEDEEDPEMKRKNRLKGIFSSMT